MTNDYKYIAYIDKDDTLHLEHNGSIQDIMKGIMTQISVIYNYLFKYNNHDVAEQFKFSIINLLPVFCSQFDCEDNNELNYNIVDDEGNIITLSEDAISMLQFLQDLHEENDENL